MEYNEGLDWEEVATLTPVGGGVEEEVSHAFSRHK